MIKIFVQQPTGWGFFCKIYIPVFRFKKNESAEEEKERLEQWEKFLQGEEEDGEDKEKGQENKKGDDENQEMGAEKETKTEKLDNENFQENKSPGEDMETS